MPENKDIRIEHISISKLFGKYDYELDFENPVSILIAPNGYGKTTIFRLINATLGASYDDLYYIKNIPFDRFACRLSDESIVTLSRKTIDSDKSTPIAKRITAFGINYIISINTYFDIEEKTTCDEMREYTIDYINEIERNPLFRSRRYPSESTFLYEAIQDIINVQKEFLINTKCFYPINFIKADRLFTTRKSEKNDRRDRYTSLFDENKTETKSPLETAVEDMTAKVRTMLRGYEKAKSDAQNSLPKLYLRAEKKTYQSFPDFKAEWDNYLSRIAEFREIGFLNEESVDILDITEEDYNSKKEFLDVYLSAFHNTVEPLYLYYDKFRLFKDIFDERNKITEKTITFTSEGVKVNINGENPLEDINLLSSGEKNDFLMFFNLLFEAKESGILMIDEPEISLHIEWQESYLDYLKAIAEKNKLQVIIATHSPHIINGNFDLVMAL